MGFLSGILSTVLGSARALPARLFGYQLESGGQGEQISDKNNLGTQSFRFLEGSIFFHVASGFTVNDVITISSLAQCVGVSTDSIT